MIGLIPFFATQNTSMMARALREELSTAGRHRQANDFSAVTKCRSNMSAACSTTAHLVFVDSQTRASASLLLCRSSALGRTISGQRITPSSGRGQLLYCRRTPCLRLIEMQRRAGRQTPMSSAELPAERTAAARCWLEPRGWVPSRRLARSSVPRHGGSQGETQAQNSVRHQECFEWLGSLIVRTSRAYLETTTVLSSTIRPNGLQH